MSPIKNWLNQIVSSCLAIRCPSLWKHELLLDDTVQNVSAISLVNYPPFCALKNNSCCSRGDSGCLILQSASSASETVTLKTFVQLCWMNKRLLEILKWISHEEIVKFLNTEHDLHSPVCGTLFSWKVVKAAKHSHTQWAVASAAAFRLCVLGVRTLKKTKLPTMFGWKSSAKKKN